MIYAYDSCNMASQPHTPLDYRLPPTTVSRFPPLRTPSSISTMIAQLCRFCLSVFILLHFGVLGREESHMDVSIPFGMLEIKLGRPDTKQESSLLYGCWISQFPPYSSPQGAVWIFLIPGLRETLSCFRLSSIEPSTS